MWITLMKTSFAPLTEVFEAVSCIGDVHSTGYFFNKGMDDLRISPDLHSSSNNSFSRGRAGHEWSPGTMSPSRLIKSSQA